MEVPSSWVDASTLRDVPDHQEVYVDETGEASVILEILEYQSQIPDEKAGRFFFTDLAEADGSINSEIRSSIVVGKREFLGTRAVVCITKGTQTKGKSGPSAVEVGMAVFRAKKFKSDILVTLHSMPGQAGVDDLFDRIADSVEFLDVGLFC